MPNLRILFAKATDPSARDVLTCIREDGTRTWSKLHAAFPIHDITHFAVESELRAANGFFGLLAQGWDITDFGLPDKRALMPLEALWVEHVVGVIWREYVTSESGSYDAFSATLDSTISSFRENLDRNTRRQGPRASYSEADKEVLNRRVSDEQRSSIMARIGELAAAWVQTPRGQILELAFSA
ncbi:MAG: hypothetical protein H0W69_06810 [Gemmatimonadaceae bacterium]|nr:hypothetical protein [Gemmatimonadaceae bacterium]